MVGANIDIDVLHKENFSVSIYSCSSFLLLRDFRYKVKQSMYYLHCVHDY